jgi:hypothetical protein
MAGSSVAPGRIEFVILRTGCSPPAALHHASLRRSGIRLQAGERLPGEDFHLSDYARFQAHHFAPNGARILRKDLWCYKHVAPPEHHRVKTIR